MLKQKFVAVALAIVVSVFFIGGDVFNIKKSFTERPKEEFSIPLPTFTDSIYGKAPKLREESPSLEAWHVFEKYLEAARGHDLRTIRELSYQTSATCNDPGQEPECFALMDSVYSLANNLEFSDFKYHISDERQIILYTDGPVVSILYFTRDESSSPKVLGLQFCLEDETFENECVETNSEKRDLDKNGWWDSVEALFYTSL